MTNLLIAAAVDFAGEAWFAPDWDRVASSLALGKAGEVTFGQVPGAAFASRKAGPMRGGARAAAPRRAAVPPQSDGSYVLLAGYVQDRAELAARLGLASGMDDSALYAAAFARFGDDCDSQINGDYAVIQWFPDQRRLRLARSPISSCPLHIWRDGTRLLVASTPRAIFATGIPARINDDKVADALLLNPGDGTTSWYAGLRRVACASVVHHDPGGTSTRVYWSIDRVAPVRFKRDSDYVEAVDEQFRRATAACLDGVRNPGVLLSGGFDSQAVASYLAQALGPDRRLPSYTGVPMAGWTPAPRPAVFGDEAPHARALAEMYPQIEPHFVDAADSRYGEKLDHMFMLGAWPPYNEMNMHWIHAAHELAASQGCDAMFWGTLGNTGFSYDGLTGYPTWLRQGRWARLAREIARSDDPRPYWRKFISLAVMPHVPVRWRRKLDRSNPWRPSAFATWCPMRAEYARTSGALERAERDGQDIDFYDSGSAAQWRAEVVAGLNGDTPEINLGMTLMYGIAPRDPTAYRPLLELCAGIPDEQYLRNGVDRWLGRRLLRGRVPEMVWSERRSGSQAADWPVRFRRDRPDMLAEMAAMRGNEQLDRIFDFERMMADLAGWPGTDNPRERYNSRINAGIGRAISAARFVKYVEQRNDG